MTLWEAGRLALDAVVVFSSSIVLTQQRGLHSSTKRLSSREWDIGQVRWARQNRAGSFDARWGTLLLEGVTSGASHPVSSRVSKNMMALALLIIRGLFFISVPSRPRELMLCSQSRLLHHPPFGEIH